MREKMMHMQMMWILEEIMLEQEKKLQQLPWHNYKMRLRDCQTFKMRLQPAQPAFQKCMVQMLYHIAVRGSPVINYDYEYNMKLKDSMGVRAILKFLSVDKPKPDLGFNLCGNQLHEFEAEKRR